MFLRQNGNIIDVTEQNIVALKTVTLNSPAVGILLKMSFLTGVL